MSNIDNIIVDIENTNQTYDFWIRDENGNIKDDVICGEVIPFLEELKNYEVDMSQDEIKDMISSWDKNWHEESYSLKYGNEYWANNTYNINANIDHDIDYRIAKADDDGVWFAFMVHRFGDVRGNYTDWAICKFDYVEEIFELDSVIQCKYFGEHYVADVNIFSETYNVYDTDKCEDVGDFYDIEVAEVLKSIHELEKD
jgi:hypothetical protein